MSSVEETRDVDRTTGRHTVAYSRDVLGWALRQDAGGLTLRLGGEMGAVPAGQGRDIFAVPRARNSVVRG